MRERIALMGWIVLLASALGSACGSSDDAGLTGSGTGGKKDAGLGGNGGNGGTGALAGSSGTSNGGTSGASLGGSGGDGGTAGGAAGGVASGGNAGAPGGGGGNPTGGAGGTGAAGGVGASGGSGGNQDDVYGIGDCPDTQPPEGFSCGPQAATCCYGDAPTKVLVCGGAVWKTHPTQTCCPPTAPGIASGCSVPPAFNCCYPNGKYECTLGFWSLTLFGDCTN